MSLDTAGTSAPNAAAREELLHALTTLRNGDPMPHRRRDHAWKVVIRHVRQVLPGNRSEDDRQDALLAIFGAVGTLRATTPGRATAWVRTICRNRAIDHQRTRRPGTMSLHDSDRQRGLAKQDPLPAELAHVVVAAFIERIDEHLAGGELPDAIRARRRAQALAAIYRLALEESLPEISSRLDLDISLVLLTKWIERGRAVVLDVVEADRARDPDLADFFAPFVDLVLEQRADAGLPRRGRRVPAP